MGNPVVHFEIGGRDKERSRLFFTSLFGWADEPYGPYAVAMKTGTGKGIDGHLTSLGHEPNNYVMVYVEVDDIPASLARRRAWAARS